MRPAAHTAWLAADGSALGSSRRAQRRATLAAPMRSDGTICGASGENSPGAVASSAITTPCDREARPSRRGLFPQDTGALASGHAAHPTLQLQLRRRAAARLDEWELRAAPPRITGDLKGSKSIVMGRLSTKPCTVGDAPVRHSVAPKSDNLTCMDRGRTDGAHGSRPCASWPREESRR